MFIQKIIEVKGVWKSTKDLISYDIQDICNLYAELLDPVFENTEAIKVTNFGHQLTLNISANEIKVFKFDGTQEKSIFVGYRKMKDIKNLYEFLQVLRNETEMRDVKPSRCFQDSVLTRAVERQKCIINFKS